MACHFAIPALAWHKDYRQAGTSPPPLTHPTASTLHTNMESCTVFVFHLNQMPTSKSQILVCCV